MHSLIKNRSCNIVPNLHAYNFPSNFFLFLNCFMFLFFTIVPNSCTVWKTFFCEYVHFPFLFLTGNLLNVPILITFPNNVSLNPNSLHFSELFLPIFKISNFKIFAPPPWLKACVRPCKKLKQEWHDAWPGYIFTCTKWFNIPDRILYGSALPPVYPRSCLNPLSEIGQSFPSRSRTLMIPVGKLIVGICSPVIPGP